MSQLRTYRIYIHQDDRWEWHCDVEADSHTHGLRQAAALIEPAHNDLPIRVEQSRAVEHAVTRRPSDR